MKKLIIAALLLSFAWIAGLLAFVRSIPETPQNFAVLADGIVVFTGGGGNRIATGMSLLHTGTAQRLLISGVNPETTRDQIAALWPGEQSQFDCCVDLGVKAQTTVGNAYEVEDWLTVNDFNSIILVTSDFHMPRALHEAHRRLPMTRITPYPVRSQHLDAHGKPITLRDWRRVAGEYSKFIVVKVLSLGT